MVDPYIDNDNIRTFTSSNPMDYVWHRDHNDRIITVLECGDGWKFQFDNNLPFDLKIDDKILIKNNVYHRLILGEGIMQILIEY